MAQRRLDVASLDALDATGKLCVEIDGTPVLLLRDGAAVAAIAATCPHAGGPLAQGVRRGTRIVCPWHKATFCIRTGKLLEPPAVDGVARYDVDLEGRPHSGRRAATGREANACYRTRKDLRHRRRGCVRRDGGTDPARNRFRRPYPDVRPRKPCAVRPHLAQQVFSVGRKRRREDAAAEPDFLSGPSYRATHWRYSTHRPRRTPGSSVPMAT